MVAVNELPNNLVVKLDRFREADRSASQTLEASPKGEILALNALSITLGDQMLVRWQ